MKTQFIIRYDKGGYVNRKGNGASNQRKMIKKFSSEDAALKWLHRNFSAKDRKHFKIIPLTHAFTKWDK